MDAAPPLARIAALIGDPARAQMLASLMDGGSRTAGELARAACITPQTASTHLSRLVDAGLLRIEKQGRHRYHRLASADVSHALEALMNLSIGSVRLPPAGPADVALRHARTCYDHLAGRLAVQLADGWRSRGWIEAEGSDWHLTEAGALGIAGLGIGPLDRSARRPLLRPCLDWSERRPHIGGQLGARLLDALVAHGWVRRRRGSRALLVSDEGERVLSRWGAKP